MAIVIDASITIAWQLREEHAVDLDAVARQMADESAVVPALWRWEVGSTLVRAVRAGRLSAEDLRELLEDMADLPITVDALREGVVFGAEIELARRLGLTVYDAAYLELALRRMLPLATLDVQLARAAREVGVQLIVPIS